LRAAAREDRRFALLAAIDAAAATDKGLPIGEAIMNSFAIEAPYYFQPSAWIGSAVQGAPLHASALFKRY
jgi:hypothetical protein